MKHFYTFIFSLFCFFTYAQEHLACDGERYRLDIFQDVESTKGVKFGEGTTFGGNFQELFMDIYEPVGDNVEKRAVIIFAFGGSFLAGAREDVEFLCEIYARKGFVTATIDYRLYDGPLFPLPSPADFQDVVSKAVADMKGSIRLLVEDAENANEFRIDRDNIFVGGISAGAIAAAHTAILDSTDTFTTELWSIIESNGGIEGNVSDNLEYAQEVKGLINFSGALNDASWLDENDPPIFSIHDEFDGVVPYGSGSATVFGIPVIDVEGSQVMHENADALGVENQLITIEGSEGHVSYFIPESLQDSLMNKAGDFAQYIICGEYISGVTEQEFGGFELFPNPNQGQFSIAFNEAQEKIQLSIFNVEGKEVWKDIYNNTSKLDLDLSLPSGMYFVHLNSADGFAFRRMVID